MNKKNLTLLAATALVLGIAAYFLHSGTKPAVPKLIGEQIVPKLDLSAVAQIRIGDKLVLSSGAEGWTIDTLHGYPADAAKIRENLLKLVDLKVAQVARGRTIDKPVAVALRDAAGKDVASLALGDVRMRKPSGEMAMYGGGYPDGRYLAYKGETVLVKDPLEAFEGEVRSWCSTRIASVPASDVTAVTLKQGGETLEFAKGTNSVWTLKGLTDKEELDTSKTYSLDSALSYLDFSTVADPKLTAAETGFATGAVYAVTVKAGSNTVQKIAHVGNVRPNSADRYFQIEGEKWIYTISSYSAEQMTKKRADFVKAKPEPAKPEPVPAEPGKAAAPAKADAK